MEPDDFGRRPPPGLPGSSSSPGSRPDPGEHPLVDPLGPPVVEPVGPSFVDPVGPSQVDPLLPPLVEPRPTPPIAPVSPGLPPGLPPELWPGLARPADPPEPPAWPEDGERRPLPRRAVEAQRLTALAFLGPLALVVLTGSILAQLGYWLEELPRGLPLGVGALLTCLLLFRAVFWPAIHHRHRTWRLTPEVLDIWEGVVWRRVISVPRSRVQHTEVGRGPIQRTYDLATLSVYTAGEERVEISLHGLEVETAEAIRDCLLNREEDHVV